MSGLMSALFTCPLGSEAALLPRTPSLAEAYHALLAANRERLARWDPGACPTPFTAEGTRAALERDAAAWLAGTRLPVAIAVREDGRWRLTGAASLRRTTDDATATVGYWIDAGFEGRGLVSAAVSVLLDHAFGEMGVRRVTLGTDVANTRSRAVAHRLGFTREGLIRNGNITPEGRSDEVVYGLLAREWAHR